MNKWSIEIAEISSSSVTNRITVEASNWINALRIGRKTLGDVGEIPQGASCTILPSGIVTILDPSSRKKFTLTKESDSSARPSVAPVPTSPSVSPQESQSVRRISIKCVSDRPPINTKTLDAPAAEPEVAAAPSPTYEKPGENQPLMSVSTGTTSDRARAESRKKKAELSKKPECREAGRTRIHTADGSPADASAVSKRPAALGGKAQNAKPVMQKTVSYLLDPEVKKQIKNVAIGKGAAGVGGAIVSDAARQERITDSQTEERESAESSSSHAERIPESLSNGSISNDSRQPPQLSDSEAQSIAKQELRRAEISSGNLQGQAAIPEQAQAMIQNGIDAAATERSALVLGTYGIELLFKRNEEPNAENPLTYRERSFLVPQGLALKEVEEALREQIAILQDDLREAPKGKFVNLAAFDHRWEGQPKRPPVAILQWKDWRGDPQIEFPEQNGSSENPPSGERFSSLEETFEVVHELQFLSTPAEGLDFVIKLLNEKVPSEASSACLYDINTNELRFVAVTGPGADQRKSEAVPLTAGLFGRAAKNDDLPMVITDVNASAHFDPEVDSRPNLVANTIIYRPITLNDQLLGMLQLINRRHQPAFSAHDINLINYVAKRLAEFIHHSRMKPDKEQG
ncbi:MAG: GAF domain-containing protein [Deltaproteobacteria bacterium]|nr:GAF domain-containing protein [Deltaproteobacteria bacterium]